MAETRGKISGRVKHRRLQACTCLADHSDWPGLAQVCRIVRTVRRNSQETVEIDYAITSVPRDQADAARLLDWWQGHWGIENRSHHVRDVKFLGHFTSLIAKLHRRVSAAGSEVVRGRERDNGRRVGRHRRMFWRSLVSRQRTSDDEVMQIRHASSLDEIAAVRTLFQEYAAALGVDLCFQNFADELATLPGLYAPPSGRLIIGRENDSQLTVGCVALRPITVSVCEMKRLYVRPEFRGRGAGKRLAESIIAEAKHIGYATMRLDTLPHMLAATRLYESLGFVRRDAYYDTPLHGTIFMELAL